MTNTDYRDVKPSDLPVIQYLNQRITFDLLATLEDGFSQFKTLETQYSDSSGASSSLQGGIGGKNVLTLLGISLGGKISESAEDSQREVTKEELVHTPSSLFARLRNELYTRSLVNQIDESGNLDGISEGDFVEFKATLHRIQIFEIFEVFELLSPILELTDTNTQPADTGRSRRSRRRQNNQQDNNQQGNVLDQVKGIRDMISRSGSQDII